MKKICRDEFEVILEATTGDFFAYEYEPLDEGFKDLVNKAKDKIKKIYQSDKKASLKDFLGAIKEKYPKAKIKKTIKNSKDGYVVGIIELEADKDERKTRFSDDEKSFKKNNSVFKDLVKIIKEKKLDIFVRKVWYHGGGSFAAVICGNMSDKAKDDADSSKLNKKHLRDDKDNFGYDAKGKKQYSSLTKEKGKNRIYGSRETDQEKTKINKEKIKKISDKVHKLRHKYNDGFYADHNDKIASEIKNGLKDNAKFVKDEIKGAFNKVKQKLKSKK